MSINATIDGTTYAGIETILVGGKTILLSEDTPGPDYPTPSFFKGANTNVANGKMNANGADQTRAFAYLTESVNGGVKYTNANGNVPGFPSDAYPFYIPTGMTKVTVACTGLCCAINCHKDENGVVTAVDNGYWSSEGGETNYDLASFIAQGATHFSIGIKNPSGTALTNDTVDSTTVQISFS